MLWEARPAVSIAITRAWISIPTDVLVPMLNLPPLHVFIQLAAISALDRLAREQGYDHR